jgi:ribose transport system permease protein
MISSNIIERNRVTVKEFAPSLVAIIVLLFIGQMLSSGFASINNIGNILTISSLLAIAAIGQALVIISGNMGIDLSVGSVISFGALIGPLVSGGTNLGLFFSILILIIAGGTIGLINGLGVQFLHIPSLVMTLAMSRVVNGFTLGFTRGQPSIILPDLLLGVGSPIVGFVRWMLIIAIIIFIVGNTTLNKTTFGKSLFACGSNRNAAKLAGLPINRIVIMAYIASGVLAALVGLLLVGYTGSGQMKMGEDYTMLSVAAVVIGGTRLSGGYGKLFGCVLGAVVLTLTTNILVVLGMPSGVRKIVHGVILLAILVVNSREEKYRL